MRSNTLAIAVWVFLASPLAVLADEPTSTPLPDYTVGPSTTASYDTCYTLTTPGPTCAIPSCAVPACLKLSTITQSCGCASIYTAYSCVNICTNDCAGTSYNTVYVPCATSRPSPSSDQTSSPAYPTQPPPDTSKYGNSTIIVTSTSIITISTCPASVTCTGQTTTWTSTQGPFPCTATTSCSCVLPGGDVSTVTGTKTVTSATTSGNVPPKPTNSIVPVNVAGRSMIAEVGVLMALVAAVVGML